MSPHTIVVSKIGFVWCSRYLLENGGDVAAVNYDGELPVDIAESDAMADLLQEVIDEKGQYTSYRATKETFSYLTP